MFCVSALVAVILCHEAIEIVVIIISIIIIAVGSIDPEG